MTAAAGSNRTGGTDPAPLLRVETVFDRIDAALILLRDPAASDLIRDV